MLIECKRGPTIQTIGGTNYHFQLDSVGRAVCEVGFEHLPIFLARPEVYTVADLAPEVQQSLQAPTTADLVANPVVQEPIHPGGVRVSQEQPQRGRPGKDDSLALAQMRALVDRGMGLNAAAAVVAERLAPGNATNQNSTRKRLLRKLEAQSRQTPGAIL